MNPEENFIEFVMRHRAASKDGEFKEWSVMARVPVAVARKDKRLIHWTLDGLQSRLEKQINPEKEHTWL